jgi:hypothetical protein
MDGITAECDAKIDQYNDGDDADEAIVNCHVPHHLAANYQP